MHAVAGASLDVVDEIEAELARIVEDSPQPPERWWESEGGDLSRLTQLLAGRGEFACFDQQVHMVGTSGRSFDHAELARALLRRARVAGAEIAVGEVAGYVDRPELHLEYASVLSNVPTDESFTFCNGVRILPVEELSASAARDALLRQMHRGPGSPGSALVVDYHPEKRYHPNTGTGPGLAYAQWPPRELLYDTQLLLALARPSDYGIARIANIVVVPEALSFLDNGVGWERSAEPTTQISPTLIGIELQRADELLGQFKQLDEDVQDRLRIVLKRLNDAKIDPDLVNKSISLRICIENIFLDPDDVAGIRRQVEARMSDYTSFSKTRSGKIYGFLSRPVHTGRLPTHPDITVGNILEELNKVVVSIVRGGGYPVLHPIVTQARWARLKAKVTRWVGRRAS